MASHVAGPIADVNAPRQDNKDSSSVSAQLASQRVVQVRACNAHCESTHARKCACKYVTCLFTAVRVMANMYRKLTIRIDYTADGRKQGTRLRVYC